MVERIVVILGPTSTGKTSLGIELCKKFDGEIVSADSRQVYKHADLGTNKIPLIKGRDPKIEKSDGYWVQDNVRINLYDMVEPSERYSAARFIDDAGRAVKDIWRRGKLPFLIGGSGFYISAFLGDVELSGVKPDPRLREKLRELSVEKLQQRLQELDLPYWQKLNRSERLNPHRLVRAIEVIKAKQERESAVRQKTTPVPESTKILKIGLRDSREQMYHKADRWAHRLVVSGKLLRETKDLAERGYRDTRLLTGMIYAPTVNYLEGQSKDKQELVQTIQAELHDYIRRQMRWFKRDRGINWVDISEPSYRSEVERLVKVWQDI